MGGGGGGTGWVDPRAMRMGNTGPSEAIAQVGDIPFPIDLASPKTPAGPRPSMLTPVNAGKGYYNFKVIFKVHVQ